jgi:hypothetical protein
VSAFRLCHPAPRRRRPCASGACRAGPIGSHSELRLPKMLAPSHKRAGGPAILLAHRTMLIEPMATGEHDQAVSPDRRRKSAYPSGEFGSGRWIDLRGASNLKPVELKMAVLASPMGQSGAWAGFGSAAAASRIRDCGSWLLGGSLRYSRITGMRLRPVRPTLSFARWFPTRSVRSNVSICWYSVLLSGLREI